jgi:thioredoxin-related protein
MDTAIPLAITIIVIILITIFFFSRRTNISPAEKEQRTKLDAQRFARLLVAEIILNNKFKVVLGRENCDLYERLKEEIEKARKIYDARIENGNEELSGYFYEELVNTLAEGDPSKLGTGYSKAI